MSIYELHHGVSLPEDPPVFDLRLVERDIYGSSRVGTETVNQTIASGNPSHVNIDISYTRTVGDKRYELSNLPIAIGIGNVLEVVTDRKLQMETTIGSGVLDYYSADVVSQSDYFPFGMLLPNMSDLPDEGEYRYAFNGGEKDDEVKGGEASHYDLGLRHYNPRIGRMMSRDPRAHEYPWQTDYAYHRNSPVNVIDYLGGGEPGNEPEGSSPRSCDLGLFNIPNMINEAIPNSNTGNTISNGGAENNNSGSANSNAKLSITKGGVNSPNSGNTLNGPNNIDVDFQVTGGTDIQKIQVTQFVKVSNDDNITPEEAILDGVIVSEDGEYMFFVDPGQSSISYYTPKEENALKNKSWKSDETKKFYEINKDGTGGRLAFSDNGTMFNDPGEAYTEIYFKTYVSVVDSKGVRTVIGYIKYGYTKDASGKITPTYIGEPTVFPATDFSQMHKQLLLLVKFL